MTKQTTARRLHRALDATFPASDAVAVADSQHAGGDRSSGAASTLFRGIAEALRVLLADVFTLFIKTNTFHWHVSDRYFLDHHLLFAKHDEQLWSMTDPVAERNRKLGGVSLRSLGGQRPSTPQRPWMRFAQRVGHASPVLVIDETPYHINFGATIADLKESFEILSPLTRNHAP